MALKDWIAIVRDGNLSLVDKERLLLDFHANYNHRVHTHLLAHGALLGCAIKHRNVKKSITQGWLTVAVIPVHSKNLAIRLIRTSARKTA